MKRFGTILLGIVVVLCTVFAAGCSDTSALQQQIEELKTKQEELESVQKELIEKQQEIQALKDEINALKSQIDINNQGLQDQLNQATAKLATLEGKINGEPIKYLKVGETASFVSNGIKLFDIQVMKGIQRAKVSTVDFNLDSPLTSDDLTNFLNITAYIYDPNTDKFEQNYNEIRKNSIIDNIDYFAEYSAVFYPNEETSYLGYFFSGTTLVAAYNIDFIRK